MPHGIGELSIFVDESGSFDSSCDPSRFYIVTCVFHDQSKALTEPLMRLEEQLGYLGYSGACVHAGPLIRREEEYRDTDIVVRRRLFGRMVAFARSSPIRYRSFVVDKRFFVNPVAMQEELARQIHEFIATDGRWIAAAKAIKIYYDNGQAQVKSLLKRSFATLPVTFPTRVTPERYRLFQAADLICTLELLRQKLNENIALSRSEEYFFDGVRTLKKNILKPIERLKQ